MTNDEVRSIGVWTDSGSRILERQRRATAHFEAVPDGVNEPQRAQSKSFAGEEKNM